MIVSEIRIMNSRDEEKLKHSSGFDICIQCLFEQSCWSLLGWQLSWYQPELVAHHGSRTESDETIQLVVNKNDKKHRTSRDISRLAILFFHIVVEKFHFERDQPLVHAYTHEHLENNSRFFSFGLVTNVQTAAIATRKVQEPNKTGWNTFPRNCHTYY